MIIILTYVPLAGLISFSSTSTVSQNTDPMSHRIECELTRSSLQISNLISVNKTVYNQMI